MSTVYILWIRQIKRYIRNRSRILGSLGQPILFLVGLGYGFGAMYRQAGGGNYLEFLTPGVVSQGILFTAVFSGIELIWDRQFGFLKETLVAPVSRFSILLGRTLGGATIAMLQGGIILAISMLIGFRPVSWFGCAVSFLVMFLIAGVFTALGTAIASGMDDFHGFQLIMNFLVMPLFFLSGALFPLTGLPPVMEYAVRLNPLTYGVDALRFFLIGMSQFPVLMDIGILAVFGLVFLFVGTYLFQRIQL